MRSKGFSIALAIATALGIYLIAYIFQDFLFCLNEPTISGQVKDSSGKPLANVPIIVGDKLITTDSKGQYGITCAKSRFYSLEIIAPFYQKEEKQEIEIRESRQTVDIQLDPIADSLQEVFPFLSLQIVLFKDPFAESGGYWWDGYYRKPELRRYGIPTVETAVQMIRDYGVNPSKVYDKDEVRKALDKGIETINALGLSRWLERHNPAWTMLLRLSDTEKDEMAHKITCQLIADVQKSQWEAYERAVETTGISWLGQFTLHTPYAQVMAVVNILKDGWAGQCNLACQSQIQNEAMELIVKAGGDGVLLDETGFEEVKKGLKAFLAGRKPALEPIVSSMTYEKFREEAAIIRRAYLLTTTGFEGQGPIKLGEQVRLPVTPPTDITKFMNRLSDILQPFMDYVRLNPDILIYKPSLPPGCSAK